MVERHALDVASHVSWLLTALVLANGDREPSVEASLAVPVTNEQHSLALARAAFEYRDFEKVVSTLYDWVHPPRIQNRENMVEARRLLGVSLHVQGDIPSAREEFAQLLLLDPNQKLDPFIHPPDIVATLEDVRRQLAPKLRQRKPIIPPPPVSEIRTVPHAAISWLPLGVPQFVLREEMVGVLLCSAQLLGLSINIAGYLQGRALQQRPLSTEPQIIESREDSRSVWLVTQYGGIALFGLAYGTSVIHSYVTIHKHAKSPTIQTKTPPSTSLLRWQF